MLILKLGAEIIGVSHFSVPHVAIKGLSGD